MGKGEWMESVRISYDADRRTDADFLAGFFRFMGILVRKEPEGSGEEADGAHVCAKDVNPDMPWKPLCQQKSKDQEQALMSAMSLATGQCFGKEQGSVITEEARGLAEIYAEQKLWLYDANLRHFAGKDKSVAAEAKEAFMSVRELVGKARKSEAGGWAKMAYGYAGLWCKAQTNAACAHINRILYFPVQNLSERCIAFCRVFPDFANAKVLLGLCSLHSYSHANEALAAFNEAVKCMGDKRFLAPVYLWMGDCYRSFQGAEKEAELCFSASNRCRKNLRASFQLAVCARNNGNLEESLAMFQEIASEQDKSVTTGMANPLELESMFKAYTQQAYILHKQGKYGDAVKAAQKAICIKDESISRNRYLDLFYGAKAARYKTLLCHAMNRDMADWIILDVKQRA